MDTLYTSVLILLKTALKTVIVDQHCGQFVAQVQAAAIDSGKRSRLLVQSLPASGLLVEPLACMTFPLLTLAL